METSHSSSQALPQQATVVDEISKDGFHGSEHIILRMKKAWTSPRGFGPVRDACDKDRVQNLMCNFTPILEHL